MPETRVRPTARPVRVVCPHCHNDDQRLIKRVPSQVPIYACDVCAKEFAAGSFETKLDKLERLSASSAEDI